MTSLVCRSLSQEPQCGMQVLDADCTVSRSLVCGYLKKQLTKNVSESGLEHIFSFFLTINEQGSQNIYMYRKNYTLNFCGGFF